MMETRNITDRRIHLPTQKYRRFNPDKNPTLLVDLDGTLVFHNANPLEDKDVFLPGAIAWLKDAKEKGYFIVLTTARAYTACLPIMKVLKEQGFIFDRLLFELPTGPRILINDGPEKGAVKAIAHNVPRNLGVGTLGWIESF
jgi:hypothetical protein